MAGLRGRPSAGVASTGCDTRPASTASAAQPWTFLRTWSLFSTYADRSPGSWKAREKPGGAPQSGGELGGNGLVSHLAARDRRPRTGHAPEGWRQLTPSWKWK